jgi:homocysteine S-methyltransferase
MSSLQERLARGDVIILDGGTGTELERQGMPMDDVTWCAAVMTDHADIVRKVHAAYIRAGADVIIANTFSTARHVLEVAGLGDEVVTINRRAVELAREARDAAAETDVWIAGSMSPMVAGMDRVDRPDVEAARASFGEQAEVLAEAGCDVLIPEMIIDVAWSRLFVEAAVATGLPVWLGFSCRMNDARDRVLAYDTQSGEVGFDDAIDPILEIGGQVAGVMHSYSDATGPGLEVLKRHWSGPLMAYAESGRFEHPNWRFVDIISPEDYLAYAQGWVGMGVQIVGGCCGIGPDHIRLLKDGLPAQIGD